MSIDLSADQSDAILRGEAIRLQTNDYGEVVVMRASEFDAAFKVEKATAEWLDLGKKAADHWAQQNPFKK